MEQETKQLDLNPLLEIAKKDKRAFNALKNVAVQCQSYELAAELRAIEVNLFPESEELKKAKKDIIAWQTAFRMVGLNIEDATAFLVVNTVLLSQKKKGKFSLQDASDLQVKRDILFEEIAL